MRRRRFLKLTASAAIVPTLASALVRAEDLPADVRITRIVGFDLRA